MGKKIRDPNGDPDTPESRTIIEGGGAPVYIRAMNRLDRYILREHLGPFLFALVVITLVLIVDFVPDVVSMVVSKGLGAGIIMQVFVLNLAWMLALSVPMAVLSGTLMAFGRLAADSEILAAKAAGVSLYRMIAPVFIVAIVIGAGLVVFNNEVLPDANHQARLLMSDIRRKRPTLDLKPNVLEDRIAGYHLLIKQMDPRTSDIADVTIFERKGREAPRTVVAKSGEMTFSADGATLILSLQDGEIHESDPASPGKYRRTAFEAQTFYLGGVADEWKRTDSEYRTDREKSAQQMLADVAVWQRAKQPHWSAINLSCSTIVSALFTRIPDSLNARYGLPVVGAGHVPARDQREAIQRVRDRWGRVNGIIERELASIRNQDRLIDQYRIEIHKKYSIPAACLVFVLIGGPLGVRARKGGAGVGLGVSLLLFLVYWAFLIGGEDLADRGIVSPVWAMWSADVLIGTIGLLMLWSLTNEVSLSPRAIYDRFHSAIGRPVAGRTRR